MGPRSRTLRAFLECLEWDGAAAVTEFVSGLEDQPEDVRSVVERVTTGYLERTPSGGYHTFYTSPAAAGNTKLAQAEDGGTLIETRGVGGLGHHGTQWRRCPPDRRVL